MSDLSDLQVGEMVEFRICYWPAIWRRATVLAVYPGERLALVRSEFSQTESYRLLAELRRVAEPRPEAALAEK